MTTLETKVFSRRTYRPPVHPSSFFCIYLSMSVYLPLSPIFLTVWVYLLLSVYRSRCVCSVLYSQVSLQISRVYLCRYLILYTSHLLFIVPLSFSISVSFCLFQPLSL